MALNVRFNDEILFTFTSGGFVLSTIFYESHILEDKKLEKTLLDIFIDDDKSVVKELVSSIKENVEKIKL